MIRFNFFSCSAASRKRRGISLIEVIACTAIAAVMMVPLTAVIRSSRQAITQSSKASPDADLRDASRWVHRLVQDGTLIDVYEDVIAVERVDGMYVKISAQRDGLIMDDGRETVVLMPSVRKVYFGAITQSSTGKTIGLKMGMEMTDDTTGKSHQLTTVVSLTPQL